MLKRLMTLEEKVESLLKTSVEDIITGCMDCTCAKHSDGYGWVGINYKNWLAHRLVFVVKKGEIPKGKMVLHKCGNRSCINPDHLYAGGLHDNVHDSLDHGTWKWGKTALKLNPKAVREIRKIYAEGGITQSELGKRFGVTQTSVSQILLGKQWSHVI